MSKKPDQRRAAEAHKRTNATQLLLVFGGPCLSLFLTSTSSTSSLLSHAASSRRRIGSDPATKDSTARLSSPRHRLSFADRLCTTLCCHDHVLPHHILFVVLCTHRIYLNNPQSGSTPHHSIFSAASAVKTTPHNHVAALLKASQLAVIPSCHHLLPWVHGSQDRCIHSNPFRAFQQDSRCLWYPRRLPRRNFLSSSPLHLLNSYHRHLPVGSQGYLG